MLRKPISSLLLGHPFETLVATWAIVTGLPLAMSIAPPTPYLRLLGSEALVTVFGLMMALGGISVYVGLCVFFATSSYVYQIIGMRLEQCGWIATASGVATLLTTLLFRSDTSTYVGIVTFCAILVACIARYLSLRSAIAAYSQSLREDDPT